MSQLPHKKVLTLLLEGKTISEIALILNVSRTTVYNRKKDFLDCAKKEGILMATKKYEVEEIFEKLSNLSNELKLNGLQVDEAKKGIEILTLLNSLQITNPEIFIKEVLKNSEELGISGDEITKYVLELKKLEQNEQKSYEQLILEINDKKEEYNKINDCVKILNEQIEKLNEDLDQQLLESEITKEELKQFVITRNNLKNNDIEIDDIDEINKLVVNFKEHDFELNDILNFFKSSKYLLEDYERIKNDYNGLLERNSMFRVENDSLEKQLVNNIEMMSIIKSLKEYNINPEYVKEIYQVINSMSNVLDISEEDAMNQFINDVKTQYLERNSYKFKIDDIKKINDLYQDKNKLIKDELSVLEEVIEDRKNVIEVISRIEKLGISDEELFEWGELIKEFGYNVSTFRNMLSEIGGIPMYLEQKTKEVKMLELKEKELQQIVSSLEIEISSLKDTLNLIQDTLEDGTIKIKEEIESFDKYFNSTETGFKNRSIRIVDDIAENLTSLFIKTESNWNDNINKLDEKVKKILNETNRILENAYMGGRIVGQFHSLEPIYKILREEEVSKIEGTIGVITMLTYIKYWFTKNYSENSNAFDEVIKKLSEGLGEIY